jgi:Carboxypeptidase regulatory-like domain
MTDVPTSSSINTAYLIVKNVPQREGKFQILTSEQSVLNFTTETKSHGLIAWTGRPGVELETKLYQPSTVTITTAEIEPAKIQGQSLLITTGEFPQPTNAPVIPIQRYQAKFDESGKAVIRGMLPGKYQLIYNPGNIPRVVSSVAPFALKAGENLVRIPYDGGGITLQPYSTTTTNAQGQYAFSGLWPQDKYRLKVSANGFSEGKSEEVTSDAKIVQKFAVIKLTPSKR